MEELVIEFKGLPLSVNQYLVPSFTNKGGKILPYMRESEKSKRFKKALQVFVKREVVRQGWDIEQTKEGHWYLDCSFVQQKTNQDSSNFYKILLDGMKGVAFDDDKNILVRTEKVLYNPSEPHTKLVLRRVKYVGVFDSEDEIMALKASQCDNCNKSKRCVIVRRAKEGRVQDVLSKKENVFVCESHKERKN